MRRIIVSLGVAASLAVAAPVSAKYEPSRTVSMDCYTPPGQKADAIVKFDKKKIIKIAVTNRCSDSDAVVEWWTTGGKYTDFALIVPANTTVDLWKKELKPFGSAVKAATGEFTIMDGIGDERWYSKVWEVQPDGSIVLVHTDSCPGHHITPASCA